MDNDTPSVISLTATATADTPFKLALTDFWLSYADVFVVTNGAYMGDKGSQTASIFAGDVYTFPTAVNLNDLFFKNIVSGSNAVITIIGTTLTRKKALEYGLVLPP
jgi:hypothetical protein